MKPEQIDQIALKKEKLRNWIGDYYTAKENLALASQGGTESGLDPEEILSTISALCEEIQPGSTDAHGVIHSSEEERIMEFANKVLEN